MDDQKREELLAQQMEVIRRMTEHNLARMGQDFWGAPLSDGPTSAKDPSAPAPEPPKQNGDAAPAQAEKSQPQEQAVQEPEPLETILAELDGYIGLAARQGRGA